MGKAKKSIYLGPSLTGSFLNLAAQLGRNYNIALEWGGRTFVYPPEIEPPAIEVSDRVVDPVSLAEQFLYNLQKRSLP